MKCSLLQLGLLSGTCLISFFAVLSQTHPLENNHIHPPAHSMKNINTSYNLKSSVGTLSDANKLFSKKQPNAVLSNNNPNTYVTPYRMKSTLAKYNFENSQKLIPILESNRTQLKSSETIFDTSGSFSGTESFVSNKVHKLQDISTKGLSSYLEATNWRQSLPSHVKRNVGDAPRQTTTHASKEISASSPTNISNEVEDSNDIKDSKPTLVVTRGALLRGFIVFVGCSVIVLVYFVLKFVCSRRQRRYSKVPRVDDLVLLPLTEEGDDDEEIFSANRRS